tara:strand:+ start:977 stop:2737 length:1761 start_codon:yes stop_codon:yes gene_type:complete
VRYLVTTALEETWPKVDADILFLGEWCKRHSRKHEWMRLNSTCCKYHWDDRNKLLEDYKYIQSLYEKIISDLSIHLNEMHSVNYSIRYWRIIIGPWLNYFLGILFDRWQTLNNVAISGERLHCYILDRKYGEIIPRDMVDFNNLYCDDDWNEAIYSQLLETYFFKSFNLIKIKHEKIESQLEDNPTLISKIKDKVLKFLDYSKTILNSRSLYVIQGLSKITNLCLQFKLGQIPRFWKSYAFDSIKPDKSMRNWSISSDIDSCAFERIARDMVIEHIPTLYLEGYSMAIAKIKSIGLPKHPKLIFTTNGYSSDEFFKFWCAEATELRAPLVIAQHGGHYGSGLFSATEEHEIKISDKYLTWGWEASQSKKTIAFGNISELTSPIKYDPTGKALIVGCGIPRYSYRMFAIPVANQWLDYFQEQSLFVDALNSNVFDQLLLRLYVKDYGWDMESRWRERHPKIKIDKGQKSIRNLISETRIYIATYNATTYLESLLWNVPTIIFWNPRHWELRPEAMESYELLKSVGIFHESPDSAAAKINEVWEDVDLWWKSDTVQAARVQFCHKFSRPIHNKEEKLSEIFSMLKRPK